MTAARRFDPVSRLATNGPTIVDLNSSDRGLPPAVTEEQVHAYILGYQGLTELRPAYVAGYELGEYKRTPRLENDPFIAYAKASPQRAAAALRAGALAAAPAAKKRAACEDRGIWTTRRRAGGGH